MAGPAEGTAGAGRLAAAAVLLAVGDLHAGSNVGVRHAVASHWAFHQGGPPSVYTRHPPHTRPPHKMASFRTQECGLRQRNAASRPCPGSPLPRHAGVT